MSYDIELKHRDGSEVLVDTPFFMRGGTVPAAVDAAGNLVQCAQREAHVNITYNYAHYYYEATDGDERFANTSDSDVVYGIRGLYGKTAAESIPMLHDMIERIRKRYTDEDGTWKVTSRKKTIYFDKTGKEVPWDFDKLSEYTSKEVTYEISEGDTSNYWESTALNAILPLMDMVHLAIACILDDVVWDGD